MTYRILVVEDDAANALLMKAMASHQGIESDGVETGEEALEQVQKEHYDLIVMDIMLPGISGIETARQIRLLKDVRVANIPIFALTAVGKMVREDCLKIGISEVFLKPNDVSNIVPAILETLKERDRMAG
jgi:CheY-like chemotaxis protein